VRQDCRQKPGLTLGEPERLKASGAPATTSRKLRRLTRSPQQLLGQSWMKSASATPSLSPRTEPAAIALEPRAGHGGRMGTAVVRRHHLYVSVLLLPITVLELNSCVRETHSVAVAGKAMVLRPRGNLFRRPIGSAGAVGPPSVPVLQEVLVLAFELVVEDDALDASALVTNLRLEVAVRAVDLGVVGQLARLLEAGVERLPRLASVLTPIRFEGGLDSGP
jgi:hypothetical protein